jgi:hypothetical protein
MEMDLIIQTSTDFGGTGPGFSLLPDGKRRALKLQVK